jgi:anhydro-N-acetylmuramic acid kinase
MADAYIWALGLMSGTSLDGIDAALILTDGHRVKEFGAAMTVPLDPMLRHEIKAAMHGEGDIPKLENEITLKHADVVRQLLQQANLKPKDVHVIGFHGQTIMHRPRDGITWQLGNGALLAERTRINVVCDFRRRDVAAGGEGAPLVPIYHAALAQDLELPVAVLNIGGIANVTWIGSSEYLHKANVLEYDIVAFDTGTGNALLNDWMLKTSGKEYDKDGELARSGTPDMACVAKYMEHPYFKKHPPKSLDRNDFTLDTVKHLQAADGAATLTRFTVESVVAAAKHFPIPATRWLVCGGGAHNQTMMAGLREQLGNVEPVSSIGWNGDALEAQAFAFLAVRSLKRLPISLPTTTGVTRSITGGAFYQV